eukprot:GHVH01012075.1.p1 GENE.GHVH01012075.1~~GHVH01012075.1.p1  ORF type:complete len:1000 (-),score=159.25 GHVH01012075.1:317-3316(-)
MDRLVKQFAATFDPAQVKQAETDLRVSSKEASFLVNILQLIKDESIENAIRLAASVYLRNWVTGSWAFDSEASGSVTEDEKTFFRRAILELVLCDSVFPHQLVFHNLSSCLTSVSDQDFPRQWDCLLPELLKAVKESSGHTDKLKASLYIVDQILLKYRVAQKSEDTMQELKYIIDLLCPSLLEVFCYSARMVPQECENQQDWTLILTHSISIYLTLHHVDIPEFFEDNIEAYFSVFIQYVASCRIGESDSLASPDPSANQNLSTLILQSMTLYAQRYESKIDPYVEDVTKATIERIKEDLRKSSDPMVSAGLELLSAVSKRTWSKNFLPELLEPICKLCILPNFKLRPVDIEEMEESPVDFIRSDVDGSGSDRRGYSRQLIEDLNQTYEEPVLAVLNLSIFSMLELAQPGMADRDLYLEAAVNLVMAVAIKVSQRERGVILTSSLVNITSFQSEHIYPILTDQKANGPLALVSALKFLYTFRNQMSNTVLVDAVKLVSSLLATSEDCAPRSCIIKTYASICLEKLLNARNMTKTEFAVTFSGAYRLDPNNPDMKQSSVKEYAGSVLKYLLPVITENKEAIVDNEHYAKLLEVLVLFIGLDIDSATLVLTVDSAMAVIQRVSMRPINSTFNHHMFEVLAAAIDLAGRLNIDILVSIEEKHLRTLSELAKLPDHDFLAYIYQLMAVFIEARSTASSVGNELFIHIIDEQRWRGENGTNISALKGILRLLKAFFTKYELYSQVVDSNMTQLSERLKLVFRHKKLTTEGYKLISAMFVLLPLKVVLPVVNDVFVIIVNNLQRQRTSVNVDSAFVLVSLYSLRLALDDDASPSYSFPSLVNNVQAGIFTQLMEFVFIASFKRYTTISKESLLPVLGMISMLAIGGSDTENQLLVDGINTILTQIESAAIASQSIERASAVDEKYDLTFSIAGEVGLTVGDSRFNQLKRLPPSTPPRDTLLRLIGPKIQTLVDMAKLKLPNADIWSLMVKGNCGWDSLLALIDV